MEVTLYTDAGLTTPIIVGLGWFGDTSSSRYFVMTKSISSDRVAQARPALALRTFIELENSRVGNDRGGNAYCPGYNCDVQHGGSEWCSEYYDYVIDIAYRDLETYGQQLSYSLIQYAFEQANAWFGNPPSSRDSLHLGDYIGVHNGPGLPIHHSTMFIAYDQRIGQALTIEGNYGNRVGMSPYSFDLIGGYGVLVPSMLK